MRAGQAYRNPTSSSKGSYQTSTSRFTVAFHVPLDKPRDKEPRFRSLWSALAAMLSSMSSFGTSPAPFSPPQVGSTPLYPHVSSLETAVAYTVLSSQAGPSCCPSPPSLQEPPGGRVSEHAEPPSLGRAEMNRRPERHAAPGLGAE